MTIQEMFNNAIEMGIASDFRTKEQIDRVLERKKQKYDKLSDEEKEELDIESLTNPYSDSKILHIAEDKEEFAEGMLRGIGLIGRLKKNAGRLYEEVYRMVVVPDTSKPGQHTRRLQVSSDNLWPATSLIAKAPNFCEPTYHTLWANWRKKKLGITDDAAVAVPMKSRPVMRRRR